VLIDRENAASALEAMKPLVDVLQKEGRSVCVAPEGTRSTSTHLGRFKKGAFYLAMQAGVPIVPIVIHNAIDVAPRGQYVFRPATVKITVLPAVDTTHWSSETMNQHVDDVRDMFLEELDQMRFQVSDQEREKSELRFKNLQRKEAANKRAKKKSAGAKVSLTVKAKAKPSKSKPIVKKTLTTKKAVIKTDNSVIKAAPINRKVKVVEPKRASRRRSRKVSTAKVSARTLDS
jgi:putative phosphoserine phosphatase/1-acylglycerol-3-phosphate O-acyltransferase